MSSISKVNRPRALLLGRQALVEKLDEGQPRLVWVCADAGCGKTSLGLEYAAARRGPVAWVRLDEADADPANFLHFLAEAVAVAGAAPGWQPPQLQKEYLAAPQAHVRRYVRSLAAAVLPGVCLAFDDVHRCQAAPFFPAFLEALAEEMPESARTLCLGRLPPPEPCARLVAHGQMREFGSADLAFSADETRSLLAALGNAASAETGASVQELTRGWAAGIALVGAWMLRRPGETPHWDEQLSRTMSGYIASEILASYLPPERHALLSVCWMSSFDADDAVFLARDPSAGEAIARLVSRGILVYEYPGRRYGLHQLFQRYLRQTVEATLAPGEVEHLKKRSVDRLEALGNREDAIELALESGLHDRAAALVGKAAAAALSEVRHHTVRRWIAALPAELRSTWHDYWLGMATFITDVPAARNLLLGAYRAFSREKNQEQRFVALSSIIGSYFLNATGAEPLRDFLAREVRPQEDYENLPDPALKAHLAFSIFSGLFITDPAHPDLDLWEARTYEVLRAFPEPFLTTRSAIMLAQHAFLAGRYRRLAEVRAALDAQPALVDPPPYARYLAFAVRLYGDLLCFDHAGLAATYAASRACGEETGAWIMDGHYALDNASGMILRGELAGAEAVLERVSAVTPPAHYNLAGHLHMIRGWAAACAGDAVRTRAHAILLRQAADGFGCVGYRAAAEIAETIAVVLDGREDPAPRLAELRRLAEEYRYPLPAIHAGFLEAWLAWRAGDGGRCRSWLAETLPVFARESGGYLSFAVPSLLAPLCAEALEAGIETDFVLGLVRQYGLPPPANGGAAWPWPVVVRCFGGFELRVNGAPLPARGKSKHRQLDLLKLLACHAPAPMATARVAEALWPDSDGDVANHALETTLSRLRSTLPANLLRLDHGLLSLDPSLCWTDTAELARRLPGLDEAPPAALAAQAMDILSIYKGDLLAGQDAPWVLVEREAVRGRTARQFGEAARRLADAGDPESAAELMRRVLEIDPHNELLLVHLLRLCVHRGYRAVGLAAYQRFRHLAHQVLEASLTVEAESLARQLQAPSD